MKGARACVRWPRPVVCRGGWGYCVQVTEVCRLWFGARVVGCSGSSSGSGLHPQFCMGASSQGLLECVHSHVVWQ